MPHVVWAQESKIGLGFEIGFSYDDIPTTSQCATDGKSTCSKPLFGPHNIQKHDTGGCFGRFDS